MKIKNIMMTIVFFVFILFVTVYCVATPDEISSLSERRELVQFPRLSKEMILSGEFSSDFESYTTDQFPKRDALRAIKAFIAQKVLGKADNNGLFIADGHISKLDSKESEEMMNHAAERFAFLYNKYLKDNKIYFSIVPDKNMYLANKNGYPSLDYIGFADKMQKKVGFMEYVDIYGLLSASDYYTTDTHWKQEKITDVAEYLSSAMGKEIDGDSYKENTFEKPFYGVYSGQYALKHPADTIKYLTSETLDNSIVTYYDTGKPRIGSMYNMGKAEGKDSYEMFLSGTMPLVTLEKPSGNLKNHLILFRDSFGSSIAPLFLNGYDKVTVIDTRYVKSDFLGQFVDFDKNADVLFLYSSTLLNNSLAIQ